MGNRTEYLLATMKTPQYDTAGFANASNQLVNALNMGANQIAEYNKQKSQAYANQYVNDLLGKTNEANYSDNIAKLRGMGAYTSPEMQKQIEGIASDIKDQRTYNIQKAQMQQAIDKFNYEKSQDLLKRNSELMEKGGALANAESDIYGTEFKNGKMSQGKLLQQGIHGWNPGSIGAALLGIKNLPEAEQANAYAELESGIHQAYGAYPGYVEQQKTAANMLSTAQQLQATYEQGLLNRASSERLHRETSNKPQFDTYTNEKGELVQFNKGNPSQQVVIGKVQAKENPWQLLETGSTTDTKTGSKQKQYTLYNRITHQTKNVNISGSNPNNVDLSSYYNK